MYRRWTGWMIALALLAALVCGCAAGGQGGEEAAWDDDWVEGGWLSYGNLASVGDVLYVYRADGQLLAYDRGSGTLTELGKPQGVLMHCMKAEGGSLYAMGTAGSYGFLRTDPDSGESERIGFYGVPVENWALLVGTAYVSMKLETGYGLYRIPLEEMAVFGTLGAPLLYREGEGAFCTVTKQDGALLLHELRPTEGAQGSVQTLVRYEPESGRETVLAENLHGNWTPCIAGNCLVMTVEESDPYALRPRIVDAQGNAVAELAAIGSLSRAGLARAGEQFVIDCRSADGVTRTLTFLSPTGETLREAAIDNAWGECLGSDGKALYFWDTAPGMKVERGSRLMALDLETLEIRDLFAD